MLTDDDTLYAALLARDPGYADRAFVGVTSTGIFCRLTCPARKPKRANVRFFEASDAALAAGFRACLRCRPLAPEAAASESEPAPDRRAAVTALIEMAPAGDARLTAGWLDTPIGPMLAIADDSGLHLLEFSERKALPGEIARLCQAVGPIGFGDHPVLRQIAAELAAYFAGTDLIFRVPLAQRGSAFARAVWAALRRIPVGETRSYGRLAAELQRPEAARAVAGANGANPLAIIVPCHRVIGADGALTGYGGKLWRKRWLLEHEARFGGGGSIVARRWCLP